MALSFSVVAANDYSSYRNVVDKLNQMNVPIQPQRYHVVKSGSKYVSATSEGSGGICNVVAGTQMLNRRIAYDTNGNLKSSDFFTLDDVMLANGVKISEKNVPYKHGNTGYVYSGATGSWYDKTYSKNGFTYEIAMKNTESVKSDMRAKGISNFEDYVAQILINHPEGICYRRNGHYVVITDYVYNSNTGKYTFYIIDGTNEIINGYEKGRVELSKTSLYKDNGVKSIKGYEGLIAYIDAPSKPVHTCTKYETYKNGTSKILGACKECHKKFDYSKVYTGDVAGLWIAKKNQNINLYSEPYEDASYTSVKSGELEVRGYVKNAYGNKWYVISGDKNKTYYVYENTFKNLYTQNSHYYENDYHRYDSGAVIESPNTNNNSGGNSNTSLGSSVIGTVDIPSSWDNLSIRSGPSTNYQIVGSMNDGVQCTVYPDKTSNGWYYVNYNGVWGYASGKQINTSDSSASSQTSTSTSTSSSTSTSTSQSTSTPAPKEKQTITISFDSNGGSTDYASQTVEKYGTVSIPIMKPSKSGYEFLGWSTYRDVSTASYKSGETINVGNTNLTFYAIWKKQINKNEWNLSLSEDELFFEKNYGTGRSVVISFYEPDGMRENIDYHLRINIDGLTYSWEDEWYDENGYKNQELTIYTPTKETYDEEVCIELIEEDNNTVIDSESFYVYLTEKDTTTEKFADRNPSGISVYLNGRKLSFDVQPQIINSRTMVPMRKIFEELGTVVGWNNNTQKAISVKKGDVVSVSIGGQYLTVNGEKKLLDSPPVIISGRTLVPVRAIAESFNCDVEWYDYGASQVVDINMKDTINSMENIGSLLIGYSEFSPFSYYDDYGNLIGFDTELAKYVCDFWGWECSFVEIPFDMSFTAIKTGQIDCYWNAISKTEERMEYATFTNEYVSFDMEYEEDGEWYTSNEVYSVPFRKGDYDTVQLVNIALEEAQKDGTIEYLKYKYGIE